MKFKTSFLIVCFSIISLLTNGQVITIEWAVQLGGEQFDSGKSITIDNEGNILTTGLFGETADFDPGPSNQLLTSAGFNDIFISKLTSSGEFIWAAKMGGSANDKGGSIITSSEGDIITAGLFNGVANFYPGTGTYNLTSTGQSDIFISKISGNGNYIWAKGLGGIESDGILTESIAIDMIGNIYVQGFFRDTVDFDPGPGVYNLTAVSNWDIFILKLDGDGNFIWAKNIGGLTFKRGMAMNLDNDGSVLITGEFIDTVDFNPGTGIYNLISTSELSSDIFVLKLSNSGEFIWAKSMGGYDAERGNSIDTDIDNSIYVTGEFWGTVDFNPDTGSYELTSSGWYDSFILKLSPEGSFIWAKKLGGITSDYGYSIEVDHFGNVYSSGTFSTEIDLNPNAGSNIVSAKGMTDVYISALNTDGEYIWGGSIGGIGTDEVNSITTDEDENIYLTGNFSDLCDLDPSEDEFFLTSFGLSDIYVIKLSQTATGNIEPYENSNLNIYADREKIIIDGLNESAVAQVYDVTGNSLGKWDVNEVNNEIEMDVVCGIFIIRIEMTKKVITQKVYLK